jgi:hypothetical protein
MRSFSLNAQDSALLLFALSLLMGQTSSAAGLEEFDKAATKNSEKKQESTYKAKVPRNDDDDCSVESVCDLGNRVVSWFIDLSMQPFLMLAQSSMARMHGSGTESNPGYEKRKPGDRDIPGISLELNYQSAEDSVYGVESKAEFGYGPAAFRVREIHYIQSAPVALLDLRHYHALLRGSFQSSQLNLGLGQIVLDGVNRNSGPSQLVQLTLFPSKNYEVSGIYIQSEINGNYIREYDGSFGIGDGGISVRGGYKVNETGGQTIHGPYLGLSWRY